MHRFLALVILLSCAWHTCATVQIVEFCPDPHLYDDADEPEYFLWRFMIDQRYQKLGFGRQALLQLIEYVKTRPGARVLYTSCVPEEGGPEPFYASLGFARNGNVSGIEVVMELKLD